MTDPNKASFEREINLELELQDLQTQLQAIRETVGETEFALRQQLAQLQAAQPVWTTFESAPKDGTEFLVVYPHQGNVYQLISYNRIHGYWQSKGQPKLGIEHQGCLWSPISLPREA